MKKTLTSISVLIIVFVLCVTTAQGVSAAPLQPEFLSVKGKGIVYVDPDLATLNFCIETRAETKDAAIKENERIAHKIKDSLKKWGSVTDDSFYSYEDMCTCKYICTRCMTLCTENVDDVSAISQKISDLGATSVNYVSYSIKDYSPHRERALKLAIEDAENKAASVVRNMQLKSIKERDDQPYCGYYECSPAGNCRKKVPVECNVTLTYVNAS